MENLIIKRGGLEGNNKSEYKDYLKNIQVNLNGEKWINDNLKFKPEVGKFLVFPAWLKHFVYPFRVKGERRMMSFNAHMVSE